MNHDYDTVERAIHFIAEHQDEQPTLEEIAAQAGVSAHHFQRVFSRWAGISPKRMLQHVTALRAGELLRRRMPLLETSLSVGLSSGSRLHDLFVTVHGMSPASYREHGGDLQITWGVAMSKFGLALAARTGQGICWLSFHDDKNLGQGIERLRAEWSGSVLTRSDGRIRDLMPRIVEGGNRQRPIHVMVKGSNFQLRVWQALLSIPSGEVATYGDVARLIEQPGAARAVGSAVRTNRVAWLIPCHRVIRTTGMVGGYRWGTQRKCMMLLDEASRREPAHAVAV